MAFLLVFKVNFRGFIELDTYNVVALSFSLFSLYNHWEIKLFKTTLEMFWIMQGNHQNRSGPHMDAVSSDCLVHDCLVHFWIITYCLRSYHWLDGHEFEQTPGDSEGQESLACCSTWGRKQSDMTERLTNTHGHQVCRLWPGAFTWYTSQLGGNAGLFPKEVGKMAFA